MEKDNILAEKCLKNPQNFGVLYDKYVKKIYNFIYYKTFHKETAEDLTAETFLKALEKISIYKTNSNFTAWLYTIARNTVIDHYRVTKNKPLTTEIWEVDIDEKENDLEIDIDNKNTLISVKKYLQNLTPEIREIIILKIWEKMSYKEIAEITGKSESACKTAFCRAINKLRTDMPLALFILFLIQPKI